MDIRHITDSQSFPLQLNSHKELAQAAYYSFDEGGNKISKVYTEDDVRDIIDFAGEVCGDAPRSL